MLSAKEGNLFTSYASTNVSKKYIYLSSLIMKVPDHVYVLGYTYTCHTLKNITDMHNNNTCVFLLLQPIPLPAPTHVHT
jgi:hypothetical protein